MNFKLCIKIKRKGFNYYTDYIEKYFDEAFSEYGYHLVRNPIHSEHSLFMVFDNSPWMTVVSKELDELKEEEIQKVAVRLSLAFKSMIIIQPFQLNNPRSVIEFYFSSVHSAHEEPPYIDKGLTILRWVTSENKCENGRRFLIRCVNHGGPSKGAEVIISGDFVENDSVKFDPMEIRYYDCNKTNKKLLSYQVEQQKIIQSDGSKAYLYDYNDYFFPEGINQYSTKLFGKKRSNEEDARSVNLYMVPYGNQNDLDTISITISPKTNRASGVYWYNGKTTNIDIC